MYCLKCKYIKSINECVTLVAEDHYHADEHDPLKASRWKNLSHNVHIQGNLCEKNKQMLNSQNVMTSIKNKENPN